MTAIGWAQILIYCVITIAITPILGAYMTRVFNGERTFLSRPATGRDFDLQDGRRRRAARTARG